MIVIRREKAMKLTSWLFSSLQRLENCPEELSFSLLAHFHIFAAHLVLMAP
jgi:hypothetical protein